jgi:hypothetical protein
MMMITVKMDLYFISYIPNRNAESIICHFHKDFLPRKVMHNHVVVPLFAADISYRLNYKQELELAEILQKFIAEKNSGYLFSEDLQRTYLMELIHFMLKIKN